MKSVISLLATIMFSQVAFAEKATIAVASNFSPAMNEIVSAFERQTPNKIQLVFGSSGKMFAQIQHGAPFAAFFSADQVKPIELDRIGLAVPGSRFTYARGQLALWSADPRMIASDSKVLQSDRIKKIAIANPRLAPYGLAAVEVMQALGVESRLKSAWVIGENIAQTYQFVRSGNAEMGFVAASQILQGGKLVEGSAWIVPQTLHQPILQDAVLLRVGENNEAAKSFLQFMRSDQVRAIIQGYGYLLDED